MKKSNYDCLFGGYLDEYWDMFNSKYFLLGGFIGVGICVFSYFAVLKPSEGRLEGFPPSVQREISRIQREGWEKRQEYYKTFRITEPSALEKDVNDLMEED